ncbi:MAG: low affinity iron permease family protein [Myxococcaceae bacterium]|nr:low affinity iron permease family protein [Myxococcaceae bacterium]
MNEVFRKLAHATAHMVGLPASFMSALGVVAVWGLSGPMFHFSDTWQLVINTGTTIVTFLMVFLIQNSQNRDAMAVHLKLDELLRAVGGARTGLVNLEALPDEKLRELQDEFERLQQEFGLELAHVEHIERELHARRHGHRRHHKNT